MYRSLHSEPAPSYAYLFLYVVEKEGALVKHAITFFKHESQRVNSSLYDSIITNCTYLYELESPRRRGLYI